MDDDLVGLDDDVLKIKDQLTGYSSKLEIIPIVGMGGIGKTTLARRVYEDPLIRYHFYIHAWIKVSQEYQERDVLLSILQLFSLHKDKDWIAISTEMLAEWVYRSLKCNRYLIVVDDIWDIETWDKMKQWFPNDNNGSRIIMTSRLGEVAKYANPISLPQRMNLLNDKQSWRLFLKKVFVTETCPQELLDSGLRIARKCQGLPLAIIVTAGHLSKISKTPESWKIFAERVGRVIVGTQEENLDIFSLSYNNLPQHLKACLLYMGNFPKSKEIPVLKLLRLWCAARILNEEPSNSSEEIAGKCLHDLINRNLIQVMSKKYDDTIKTCGLHDLLWDFILIEAQKGSNSIFSDAYCTNSYFHSNHVSGKRLSDHIRESGFKLLKFLHLAKRVFYFPDEITELINLRYLALASCSNIPGSVSKLRNLETLINHDECAGPILPKEI